jgi:uncharacterized protein (DUF427 family)
VSYYEFEGYLVMNHGEGIKRVSIKQDEQYVNAWVDGDLCDDVATSKEFAENYGREFYLTFDDARKDVDMHTIEEVWPGTEEFE